MGNSFTFDSIYYSIKNNPILKGVYLQISENKIIGIFGRNGSGKSTLIKIGAGQIAQSNGNVFIDGSLAHPLKHKLFQRIAYLPQENFLPRDLTVSQIISMFPTATAILTADELIAQWKPVRAGSLSYGQLRYLEVVSILSLGRSYALLDEPFTSLEPNLIERLISKIVNYSRQGHGVMIADHYYQYLLPIISDAYILLDGQSKKLSHTEELYGCGYLSAKAKIV
ncbi:MAG TPA: ATP-binding cassette domain-containing protein [Bacteroidota bacterium]|nr:ATP-binding cassette domain-containing protein [Bacteroidota bacterium]